MTMIITTTCPECFSKKCYQFKDKTWKCSECNFKTKRKEK